MRFRRVCLLSAALIAAAATATAQEMPPAYKDVLTTLGRQGDFKDNVLKINIPRSDLQVTVANVATPTPFGFGGWIAMTKGTGGKEVMMGDLVLTQEQVNPVLSALLDNGLEVTALHNHFFWEEPRLFFMHVRGSGSAADLAREVKPALDLVMKAPGPTPAAAPAAQPPAGLDTAKLATIAGHDGEQNGAVYKITVGRSDLKVLDMGAAVNSRMGLNTWAAFVGTNENAAIAGDVAMLANEVQPVLRALRKNGLDVVSIHQHMLGSQPAIYFLHYWGTGAADTLAAGFRSALDQLGERGGTGR